MASPSRIDVAMTAIAWAWATVRSEPAAGRRAARPGDRRGGAAAARGPRPRRARAGRARQGRRPVAARDLGRRGPGPRDASARPLGRGRVTAPAGSASSASAATCRGPRGRPLGRPPPASWRGDRGTFGRQPHPPLVARAAGRGEQRPVERDDPARGERAQPPDQPRATLRGGELAGRPGAALELVDEVAIDGVEPGDRRRRRVPARRRARAARACPAAASPGARSRPGPGSGRRSSARGRARAVAAADRRRGPVRGWAAEPRRPGRTPPRPSTMPSACRFPNSTRTASPMLEIGQRVGHRVGVRARAAGPRGIDGDLDEPRRPGGPAPRPGRDRGSRPGPRRGLAASGGADGSPR